jgi:cell division protein FtsW
MTQDKRTKSLGYDPFLVVGTLLLLGIGVVMVYSASSAVALKRFGSDTYFFKRQVVYALAAIAVLIMCRHIPYPFYRKMAYPILAVVFLLLIALYLPGVGHPVGGARRWFRISGISFQPSELARLALIIYLAYSMSKKQEQIKVFAIGFLPHAIVLATLGTLVVMQPDFGMAVMLALITWAMLFVGGVRLFHLFTALAAILPIAYYLIMHVGYRVRRLASFLDPWRYESDAGYQIVHSLMALGSGGVTGSGIGNSYQKLFYLPEPHTDFVISVLGEELGFVGVCFVVGLYVMLVWRGIVVAMKARGRPL